MTWLSAAIFIPVLGLAWAARRSGGSWYAPAAFFAGYWCIFGGLPLIASPVAVVPAGMLFLAAACGAVLLGAWLAQRWRGSQSLTYAAPQEPPLLGWLVAGCTLLGFAVVLLILYSVERSGSAVRILSLGGVVETIHNLAVARNGGRWEEPAAARVLTTFLYLGPMLSGVVLAVRKTGRARWLSLLTFAPSVLVTVILTTKSSILLPLALFAAAYIAAAIATSDPPRLSLKRAAALAGFAVVLIGGFVLVQMARYAGWASGSPGAVLNQLWLSLFPYFGVFSGWLQDHGLAASTHPTLGSYTFAGVFDLLHLHGRVAGLYTEQVVISGTQYNIYTAFRGLVEDFTIPGALVFLALAGFGAQLAYRRVRAGDVRFVGLLAAFYAAILWSFVVDIFIYNTIVLSFVLLAGYLAVARLAARPSVLARQVRAKVAPGR